MSLARRLADRQKLTRLLELTLQQVSALETDDMARFDALLAERQVLVDGFAAGRDSFSAEHGASETLVARIQDADKAAQCLLYQQAGKVMREMNRLRQQEKARGAYFQGRSVPARPIGFLPDTPAFMDTRS